MEQHPIDRLAAVIRRHPNHVDTPTLAAAIAKHLDPNGEDCDDCARIVAAHIDRINPDRTMGAGALAEQVWNELVEQPA